MLKKLVTFLSRTDGHYHHFSQFNYMNKNTWVSDNPRKLTGAWIGHFSHPITQQIRYGLKGVCLGLSAAYLVRGQSWNVFSHYMNTSECHRLTLGIMNYQQQYGDVTQARNRASAMAKTLEPAQKSKSLFRRFCHKETAVIPIDIKYVSTQQALNILLKSQGNINFITCFRFGKIENTQERVEMLIEKIQSNFGYLIDMKRTGGGHSVAITTGKKRIKFFDPNQGEFSYPDTKEGREYFKVALALLFDERYPDYKRLNLSCYTYS